MKKALFLGSDRLSRGCLEGLLAMNLFDVEVWSTGDSTEPGVLATENNLKFHWEKGRKMNEWTVTEQSYEFLVVASFGLLIPPKIINRAKFTVNVHPSLLPKSRGAAPIQYTLYNREPVTGVSLITVDAHHFDKGKILLQEQLKIPSKQLLNSTYSELRDQLTGLGREMLTKVVLNYTDYLENCTQQDDQQATYTSKISQDFCKINWNSPAETVFAKFRCLHGSAMHCYFMFKEKRVLPTAMRRVDSAEHGMLPTSRSPGTVSVLNNRRSLFIRCQDTHISLEAFELQSKQHSRNRLSEFIGTYFKPNSPEVRFD